MDLQKLNKRSFLNKAGKHENMDRIKRKRELTKDIHGKLH